MHGEFTRIPWCVPASALDWGDTCDRLAFPPANLAILAQKELRGYAVVHPVTALLVDDDDSSYQATQRQLESDGYTVLVARNAGDRLARAKRSVPDVIFTHLVTGADTNVAFIQALRSDDGCRHLPVNVLTVRPESRTANRQLRPVSRTRW